MNRPLICNSVNSAGAETFTPTGATSATNNTCPTTGSNTVAPVTYKTGVAAGVPFNVNVTLLADAVFTITVTDAKGCTKTCTTNVSAKDVRCFSGNSQQHKYTMCHKTGNTKNPCVTICVDENAVNDHLAHGDYLGTCDPNCAQPASTTQQSSAIKTINGSVKPDEIVADKLTVNVMPNPSVNYFTLLVKSGKNDKVNMRITDLAGRLIEQKIPFVPNSTILVGSNFLPGIYIAELIQGKERILVKLVKSYR